MTLSSLSSTSSAEPRWATPRTDRPTYGGRIARVAEAMGTPFMPWQRQVADVVGEHDPETGLLAYRTAVISVPRQSGKTTLLLGVECDRCVNWGSPQRVFYSAQTGWDARRKLLDDQVPLLQSSKITAAISRVFRGAGNEAIIWRNGSRIDVMASTEGAGHGRTVDLGVIDELFDDTDDRREQAMLPAMATRKDAQILVTSTAGTERSVPLKQKVQAGRAAVERGDTSGVAYFEWSVPDEADIDDPAVWYAAMPALGLTIDEAVVEHARRTMSEGEFRRSFCNQWYSSEERVIPLELWEAVQSDKSAPDPVVVFAVDAAPDLSWAAIVAADPSGRAELVETQPGTGWLEVRLEELVGKFGGLVAVDASGPIGWLTDRVRTPVDRYTPQRMAYACGELLDRIAQKRVSVRRHGALDMSVKHADRKTSGDRWVWQRSSDVDVSPLVALTMALATARGAGEPGVMFL